MHLGEGYGLTSCFHVCDISFLQVGFPRGQEYFTQQTNIPNCDVPVVFQNIRSTAVGGLYGSKRSHLQPTVFNVNEQFSPKVHLPWTCLIETFWRDLGENYFPRFVKDGNCISSACWYGHYLCQPVEYKVNVIRKQHHYRCVDRNLPSTLASEWKLAEVNVTVACICARR